MDDFVIIHHDKDYLKKCKDIIEEKLKNEYKLELNAKSTIYDINNGFDFLGYTYKVKNNKTIISISRKTFKNIKKHIKTILKLIIKILIVLICLLIIIILLSIVIMEE